MKKLTEWLPGLTSFVQSRQQEQQSQQPQQETGNKNTEQPSTCKLVFIKPFMDSKK